MVQRWRPDRWATPRRAMRGVKPKKPGKHHKPSKQHKPNKPGHHRPVAAT
ncbi:hypothetical protein ACGFYU_05905 [Streptomyces sp. NPDC048337]